MVSPVRVPLAIRIPVVMMIFMVAIAVFISERVLTRLQEAQERHLGDLATVYLDGLSASLVSPVLREDVWEVFDIVDRARRIHAGIKATETLVALADGRVIASSNPRLHPSWSRVPTFNPPVGAAAPAVITYPTEDEGVARRYLTSGDRVLGFVQAAFDVSPLLAERRTVLWTLIATNAALTMALALVAWLTVRRMMRPLRVLATHLRASSEKPVEAIPENLVASAPGEFRGLFAAINGMVGAVRERETLSRHLAEEERLASLGRLASGMAHEINNPLGGLFNAIDTLKEHGDRPDVRQRTLDLIDRGLKGIRDVVRATLVTYRADREIGSLQRADIDDLKLLIASEVHRKQLDLSWENEIDADMLVSPSVVRQVLLNLLLNACQATPERGNVSFHAGLRGSFLIALVSDSGPGLSESAYEVLAGQRDQAVSQAGSGLGLWMVRRLVKESHGAISARPRAPQGTTIEIALPLSQATGQAHAA